MSHNSATHTLQRKNIPHFNSPFPTVYAPKYLLPKRESAKKLFAPLGSKDVGDSRYSGQFLCCQRNEQNSLPMKKDIKLNTFSRFIKQSN